MHVLGDMIRFPPSSYPLRALPCQKSNGSNVVGNFLVYRAVLQLILCAICMQHGVFLFLSAMSCPHTDSRENSLPVSTVCSKWSNILPRRKFIWTAYFCRVTVQSSRQDVLQGQDTMCSACYVNAFMFPYWKDFSFFTLQFYLAIALVKK